MAYMSQDAKTRLAGVCKAALAAWPGMKWTLSVRNKSTIVLTISQGDIDFAACVEPSPFETSMQQTRIDKGHVQVNHHYIDRDWNGAARAFLSAANAALRTGNHDNSDIQSDYFDVGWYVDIQIGRWNKPYRFTGAAAAAAVADLPATQAELVERMNEAAASLAPAAVYTPVYPKRSYTGVDEVAVGDIVRMNHRDHLGNPIESPQFDDCVIAAIDGAGMNGAGIATLHRPLVLCVKDGTAEVAINTVSVQLELLVERFSVLTTGHDGHKSTCSVVAS
jgi:hypothetical protein